MGSRGGIRERDEGTGKDDVLRPCREREKSRFGFINCWVVCSGYVEGVCVAVRACNQSFIEVGQQLERSRQISLCTDLVAV
jgi:hypothetical protein